MLDHLARPDTPATVQSTPALAAAGRDVEQDDPNLVSPDLASRIEQERGGGRPLDAETRVEMESSFGQDFGDVRVHTGSQADQLNQEVEARAFTTGSDVFFRDGTYAPGSSAGKELLAHELTHVVQQSEVPATGPSRITSPDDAVEKEAASVAEAMVARQAEEEGLPLARQMAEEEELPLARQMAEEEELPLARQMEEEEELQMARQMEEEEELPLARIAQNEGPDIQRDAISAASLGVAVLQYGQAIVTSGNFSCSMMSVNYMHKKTPPDIEWTPVSTEFSITAHHPRYFIGTQEF